MQSKKIYGGLKTFTLPKRKITTYSQYYKIFGYYFFINCVVSLSTLKDLVPKKKLKDLNMIT